MITVSGLRKKFALANAKKLNQHQQQDPRLKGRFFHSVTDVSFTCETGQVLGLLGPNGAGKTTTLRMLSTALKPDAGLIEIGDINLVKNSIAGRKKIGFLTGATGLYGRLSGRENIEYFARLQGMNRQQIKDKIEELSALLGLGDFLERRCENYSTGMKQKISIARAVVHSPDVVILDEPTTGLDIMATETVLAFIRTLKSRGTPIIFSTHHLDEVEELCDKVVVIDQGEVKFDDSFRAFSQLSGDGLHSAFMRAIANQNMQEND